MMNIFFLQAGTELEKSTVSEVVDAIRGIDRLEEMGIEFLPKIISAIFIGVIGLWLIKWLTNIFMSIMKRRKIEASLQSFLSSLTKISLYVLLALTVISVLGINITGFAALLAGAGLAIGSALNGSLGNFAGGVMILLLKPFRVGDLIEAQGQFGIVKEIGIVYTSILTSQNKTIRLPNGALSTGVVNNFTDQENLRIDIKVPVADYTDVDKAIQVAIEAMKTVPCVISDPEPGVRIAELTGDGPLLVLWPRIKVKPYDPANPRQMEADYYTVYFGVRKAVYDAFLKNGIATPSSTLEVTMMGTK
ncbi:MAG: mechanosensitive ion channel family protein [Chitinophagales bacterium]|nr:mechanosensitive ion channel family protein [Chitinophagales bacterium]